MFGGRCDKVMVGEWRGGGGGFEQYKKKDSPEQVIAFAVVMPRLI